MNKLLTFLLNITTDPVTGTFYKDSLASAIWLPIKSKSKGVWQNYYSSTYLDLSFGVWGSENGGPDENCGILVALWNGWAPWACKANKVYYKSVSISDPFPSSPQVQTIYCACEHQEQMYLKLRGLCPDSNIDQVYVPRNKPRSGKVNLLGFRNTVIEYKGAEFGWLLKVDGMLDNTTAVSKAPLASFALGKQEWVIEGDNMECSTNGEPYTRILKLTGCREGEFTCSDGQCIRSRHSYIIYQFNHISK